MVQWSLDYMWQTAHANTYLKRAGMGCPEERTEHDDGMHGTMYIACVLQTTIYSHDDNPACVGCKMRHDDERPGRRDLWDWCELVLQSDHPIRGFETGSMHNGSLAAAERP